MSYKTLLFETNPKPSFNLLRNAWKWTKLILGVFLIFSAFTGCCQIMFDNNVASNKATSVYDGQKHNVIGVFFEFVLGVKDKSKNHIFYLSNDNDKFFEYGYNAVYNWSDVWKIAKLPFFGIFVYPMALFLVSIISLFSGYSEFDSNSNVGVSVIFALILLALIVKLSTLAFTFKAQRSQERLQVVQAKVAEIQNKYKNPDPISKQKMQLEIMNIYKKEGINPFTSMLSMFLTIPFLTAMFVVVRSTRLLKILTIGEISLINAPWEMITVGKYIYLIIILIYIPIQLISMLLPMYINKRKKDYKNKAKANEKNSNKQILMQLFFVGMSSLLVFSTPSGVGIYWIITGFLQILQTIFFHYYNSTKTKKRYLNKQKVKIK